MTILKYGLDPRHLCYGPNDTFLDTDLKFKNQSNWLIAWLIVYSVSWGMGGQAC